MGSAWLEARDGPPRGRGDKPTWSGLSLSAPARAPGHVDPAPRADSSTRPGQGPGAASLTFPGHCLVCSHDPKYGGREVQAPWTRFERFLVARRVTKGRIKDDTEGGGAAGGQRPPPPAPPRRGGPLLCRQGFRGSRRPGDRPGPWGFSARLRAGVCGHRWPGAPWGRNVVRGPRPRLENSQSPV